jgi:hypothetical protein
MGDSTESANDTVPDDAKDSERKEYYLALIRKIIDEQKELLGEKAALKQARRAPLHIDKDRNVVDFYGNGEKALETLRQFTDHQELYLKIIQAIVSAFKTFLGDKTALAKARKAPLFIDKNGEVSAYYGNGKNAVDILVQQFETVLGAEVAHLKIRNVVRDEVPEEQWQLLPERIQPSKRTRTEREKNLINRLVSHIKGTVHVTS